MKTLLLNVKENTLTEMDVPNTLENIYEALGVTMIEMPVRSIGGKAFTLICDEEGMLKADPKVACVSKRTEYDIIVGNVMFVNDNLEGDVDSLTDEDIDLIRDNCHNVFDPNCKEIRKIVVMD